MKINIKKDEPIMSLQLGDVIVTTNGMMLMIIEKTYEDIFPIQLLNLETNTVDSSWKTIEGLENRIKKDGTIYHGGETLQVQQIISKDELVLSIVE